MPPMPPMGPGGRKPGGPHGARLTMEKPKDAKNTLKKLIGYIGRNRYLFFALIGVMLIITLLNLAAPSIQQIAIDCITLTKKKTSVDFSSLGKTLIGLGAVYLLSSVFTYMQGIFSAKLSQYTVKTMRKDLFSSLVRLPIKYLDTHSHGDIMSRMTNDVENISTTISQSIGSLISGYNCGNSCHNASVFTASYPYLTVYSVPYHIRFRRTHKVYEEILHQTAGASWRDKRRS